MLSVADAAKVAVLVINCSGTEVAVPPSTENDAEPLGAPEIVGIKMFGCAESGGPKVAVTLTGCVGVGVQGGRCHGPRSYC